MLTHLAIENFALIEKASLEPNGGLNVLTGESGAGKSIVLDALAFVTGNVRPRSQVRLGQDSGLVEAQFSVSEEERALLRPLLEPLDLTVEEEIVLGRRLEAGGRSRSYVQGRLVPRSLLAEVSAHLVEFSDQGDSHALKSPLAQLKLLDLCLGLGPLAAELTRAYELWREREGTLSELERRVDEIERRRDFLEFQLAELEAARADEYEGATARLAELEAARTVAEYGEQLESSLVRSDESVLDRLEALQRRLRHLPAALQGRFDDAFTQLIESVEALASLGDEATRQHEFSPAEAAALDELVRRVNDLARKHRVPPESLGERALALRGELEELERVRDERALLARETERAREAALELARRLHEERQRGARLLEKRVRPELAALGLERARLVFELEEVELGPTGVTHLELGYASHDKAPVAPLGRVASGGELGRVLLALRLATGARRPLLVLDEIDAGVGGVGAERIGESLERASRAGQILAITHWPQVAARASTHFVVRRRTTAESTSSDVAPVQAEGRIDELCRMLGSSLVTARPHAEALLRKSTSSAETAVDLPDETPTKPAAPRGDKRPDDKARRRKLRVVSRAA